MFWTHIIVEYCTSVESIKYICKYINKVSNITVFAVTRENFNVEIIKYQMSPYINSNEAIWRILSFSLHDRDPTIIHITVHLENGQRVVRHQGNGTIHSDRRTSTNNFYCFYWAMKNNPFANILHYPLVKSYNTWNTFSVVHK